MSFRSYTVLTEFPELGTLKLVLCAYNNNKYILLTDAKEKIFGPVMGRRTTDRFFSSLEDKFPGSIQEIVADTPASLQALENICSCNLEEGPVYVASIRSIWLLMSNINGKHPNIILRQLLPAVYSLLQIQKSSAEVHHKPSTTNL